MEAWFAEHDKNKSGVLEREQLAGLIQELDPEHKEPTSEALDMLMKKAIEVSRATATLYLARVRACTPARARAVAHRWRALRGRWTPMVTGRRTRWASQRTRA